MQVAAWPTYGSYKDSGVEWIGEVPQEWSVKRLKHLVRQVSDKVSSKDSTLRYIGMENVESWSGRLIDGNAEVEGLAAKFTSDDVIFGKLRPYLAKATRLSFSGICSTEFIVFRAGSAIEPAFLAYLLRSPDFVNFIDSSTYGSKMPRANPSFIANCPVVLPPVPEQRAIAAFLDEKCAKVDEAVRIKEAQIALLRERRQILIQQVVTRGLNPAAPMKDSGIDWIGQIPAHWAVKRNKHMFFEVNERSAKGTEQHLSMSQKLGLVPANLVEKSLVSESYEGAKLVRPGDLVLNRLKAHLAVFSIAPMEGLVSPDYSVFRPFVAGASSRYFDALFKTSIYLGEFRQRVRGIVEGFFRLYTDSFMDAPLIIPPQHEQDTIMDHLEQVSAQFDDAIYIKEAQITALKEYKTCLINAAVTGKIKVA